jgi:hypothetical protein
MRIYASLESQMARGYRIDDKLPQPLTMLVSALSQLWVFGLYEILRTLENSAFLK